MRFLFYTRLRSLSALAKPKLTGGFPPYTRDQVYIKRAKLNDLFDHVPPIVSRAEQKLIAASPSAHTFWNCSGCGATLHNDETENLGFVPSDELDLLEQGKEYIPYRKRHESRPITLCLRCKEIPTGSGNYAKIDGNIKEFAKVIERINSFEKPIVILVADLTELPHTFSDQVCAELPAGTDFILLGNKLDLIPGDRKRYKDEWKKRLLTEFLASTQVAEDRVLAVSLVSALNGHGIEHLVEFLLSRRFAMNKRPMFLVGAQNSGKSRLFNRLLLSDLCKMSARNSIHRATVANFPGTTANLLSFPVNRLRAVQRDTRMSVKRELASQGHGAGAAAANHGFQQLQAAPVSITAELREDVELQLSRLDLRGLVALTNTAQGIQSTASLSSPSAPSDDLGREALTYEPLEWESPRSLRSVVFRHREFSDLGWLFDTPGYTTPQNTAAQLSPGLFQALAGKRHDRPGPELYRFGQQPNGLFVLPRVFTMRPGLSLLLGLQGRLDLVRAPRLTATFFVTHSTLPVHIVETARVEEYLAREAAFMCPGVDRRVLDGLAAQLAAQPIVGQKLEPEGEAGRSSFDVVLSNAGWVSVTSTPDFTRVGQAESPQPDSQPTVDLCAWTWGARGITLRQQPLIPFAFKRKGRRAKFTREYKSHL